MGSYLTASFPGTGGSLKGTPEDFLVEELPLYTPCGEGEHLYLEVEKRGLTTFDLLQHLSKALKVPEREIGYAGLKDARATTRQTVSVTGVRPEQALALELAGVRILSARFHRNKLRLGHLAGNRFEAMLVNEGALVLKFWFHLSKKQLKERLKALEKDPQRSWQLNPLDWKQSEVYDRFVRFGERVLRRTSRDYAPWYVIEGADEYYRSLSVGRIILEGLQAALKHKGNDPFGTPAKYAEVFQKKYGTPPDYTEAACTAAGLAFEAADALFPITDLRWVVAHVPFITEDYVNRLKALGGGLSLTSWRYLAGTDANDGPPFRMIVDNGIPAGMSSDGMQIAPMNPWLHMYYATTGVNARGDLINDGQQINRREVLRLYTSANGWFLREEDDLGTIEPGKLADLIAIDGDPIADISTTHKVRKVIANGRVYDTAQLAAQKQP